MTDWQRQTIGELCQFRGGGTPSKEVAHFWRGPIPWISPKDMKSEIVSDSIDHISEEAIEGSATSWIPEGSVLMVVRSGILARTIPLAIAGRALTINQDLKALCPVKEITPRYLYYFLSSQTDLLLSKVSRGATVHRLATEDIRALEVPFPSVAEQRRIVAILDEAFDGIAKARANAERNLESIRTLAPGLIDAELASTSRETRALGELVEASCSLSYGIVQPGEEFEGGLPIVRPVDLGEKFIGLEGLKRVDPKRASGYQRTRLSGGDLLLCVRGDTGIVSIAGDELRDANVTRGIVPIRFDSSQVGQDFGYYLMRSSRVQSQIKQKTYGAALMQINIRDLRELRLPVVALPDQKRLVGRLNQELEDVQSLERAAETKLVALDDLKKSLLHHAFTGQL